MAFAVATSMLIFSVILGFTMGVLMQTIKYIYWSPSDAYFFIVAIITVVLPIILIFPLILSYFMHRFGIRVLKERTFFDILHSYKD